MQNPVKIVKVNMPLRLLAFLIVALFGLTVASNPFPISAQSDTAIISPANAARLQRTDFIGGVLPGRLDWSPDGETLVAGTTEGIYLYPMASFPEGRMFIPGSSLEYTIQTDGTLIYEDRVWNMETGGEIGSIPEQPNPPPVFEGASEAWNESVRELLPAFAHPSLDILDVQPFYNEQYAIVRYTTDAIYAGEFADIRIFNVQTGAQITTDYYMRNAVAVNPERDVLLIPLISGDLEVWHGEERHVYNLPNAYATFSPDGRIAVAWGGSQTFIWTTEQLRRFEMPIGYVEDGAYELIVNASGNIFALLDHEDVTVYSTTDYVRLFNLQRSAPLRWEQPYRFAISPNGTWLRAGTQVYSLNGSSRVYPLPEDAIINSDWRYAAYWANDNVERLDLEGDVISTTRVLTDYIGQSQRIHAPSEQVLFLNTHLSAYNLRTDERTQWWQLPSPSTRTIRSPEQRQEESLSITVDERQYLLSLAGQIVEFFPRQPEDQFSRCAISPNLGSRWCINNNSTDSSTYTLTRQNAFIDQNRLRAEGTAPSFTTTSSIGDIGYAPNSRYLWVEALRRAPQGGQVAELYLLDQEVADETSPVVLQIRDADRVVGMETIISENNDYIVFSIDRRPLGDSYTSPEYTTHLWSLETFLAEPTLESALLTLDTENVSHPTFTPDQTRAFFIHEAWFLNFTTQLYDLATGEQITTDIPGTVAAIHPESTLVVTRDGDTLTLYDIEALAAGEIAPLHTLTISNPLQVEFSPDGQRLYVRVSTGVFTYTTTDILGQG